ncbi:MAG: alpha-hydroxy-acid oxidizing protein [Rhizobacter sp.]|nr:alpha-hydroxy-acid oxidizing protein [Chlorobiales bacterium]
MNHENITHLSDYLRETEKGACAIIAGVKKTGVASHGNVKRTLESLENMGHRTGQVEHEGDGAGIQTDIPRKVWEEVFLSGDIRKDVAYNENLIIGHLLIRASSEEHEHIIERIIQICQSNGLDVVLHRKGLVRPEALGKLGRDSEPLFYQVAMLPANYKPISEQLIFRVQLQLERDLAEVHIASLSSHSVIYKVKGDAKTLRDYFPDLRNPDFKSAISLAHGRFSTNTDSITERAQMFSTLGHNGEINTISKLRHEAKLLGVQLTVKGSDSQDLDRIAESLMFQYGFSLMETISILFPPVWSEIDQMPDQLKAMYTFYRRAFGSLAQGPAALICRQGDEVVFSCDAMGLRPLWFGETEKEYFASSEKGVVPLETMVRNPVPLAPGEKRGFILQRQRHEYAGSYPSAAAPAGVKTYSFAELQSMALEAFKKRFDTTRVNRSLLSFPFQDAPQTPVPLDALAAPLDAVAVTPSPDLSPEELWEHDLREREQHEFELKFAATFEKSFEKLIPLAETVTGVQQTAVSQAIASQVAMPVAKFRAENLYSAFGWIKDDADDLEKMAESGKEVLGSMGYDGALASLSKDLRNLPDYFKETVAVVTNPAVDGIRESEHFSTKMFLGKRPNLLQPEPDDVQVELAVPLVFSREASTSTAARFKTATLNDVFSMPHLGAKTLHLGYAPSESLAAAIARLSDEAVTLVRSGAAVLILSDDGVVAAGFLPVPPLLALAAINNRLLETFDVAGEPPTQSAQPRNLRRMTSLIVASGTLRNLHDMMLCLGLGANAVAPYLIEDKFITAAKSSEASEAALFNVFKALVSGIEKVISTMGIHELEGYGKVFASIGFSAELQEIFKTRAYLGSETRGKTLSDLDREARERFAIATSRHSHSPRRENRFNNKLWKTVGDVAAGDAPYSAYLEKFAEQKSEFPVAIRHILDFVPSDSHVAVDAVNIRVGGYQSPMYISAMSFGSQGETSFRSYAAAGAALGIICINGEGGEISDMMGKLYRHRGQQIASARFGVTAEMLNSAKFLEIKIGQGAKPGEGGHLPGFKVTGKIAAARHTAEGIDLISPANNHDIYSIEDLAQLIEELKTINPDAKISVKVPAIPLIAPIATGIAKAGADIIAISGYEGGTGAARKHSLRHVGFPVEIAVKEAHLALLKSGLRSRVELWADGGMRSGEDVVKLMMLGANRVGFGTLAMQAIGCTQCRKCNTGTCHVGITSHFTSPQEAAAAGQKIFHARELDTATLGIVRFFTYIESEIKSILAALGVADIDEIVGRSNLLVQSRFESALDLELMTEYLEPENKIMHDGKFAFIKRPLTSLTRMVSASVMQTLRERGTEQVVYTDEDVMSSDRALGTHLAGELTRHFSGVNAFTTGSKPDANPDANIFKQANLEFLRNAIPGNGLGAFGVRRLHIKAEGGAQDGVAKGSSGGKVVVLKGKNHDGILLDGSVGKYFAYGATGGLLIVQGNADSRACIRLSGADVVLGGEVELPIDDRQSGSIAARANLKGFAFEYMTSGRVLVLGDPGPWMCSGMTGGTVYFHIKPELNLTLDVLRGRLSKSTGVKLAAVTDADEQPVSALLNAYHAELKDAGQTAAASKVHTLQKSWRERFVRTML